MHGLPPPRSLRAWVLALRLKTLPAATTPVIVGTGVSLSVYGHAWLSDGWLLGVLALLGALLLQVASNFANDAFDFEKGADGPDRLGPPRAAQLGLLTPRDLKLGLGVVLGAALLIGLILAWQRGWPIVIIGVASMLAAVAYTAGPYPLGYHGLGDACVMLFFGFVAVVGTVFVQTGEAPALAFWAALPVGALATAILVVNNLRDRAEDARAGKRTLAVRLGDRGAVGEYLLLCALAYSTPLLILGLGLAPLSVLLPLLSAPLAARLILRVNQLRGRALNPALGQTAGLLLVYGALFAIGLGVG